MGRSPEVKSSKHLSISWKHSNLSLRTKNLKKKTIQLGQKISCWRAVDTQHYHQLQFRCCFLDNVPLSFSLGWNHGEVAAFRFRCVIGLVPAIICDRDLNSDNIVNQYHKAFTRVDGLRNFSLESTIPQQTKRIAPKIPCFSDQGLRWWCFPEHIRSVENCLCFAGHVLRMWERC